MADNTIIHEISLAGYKATSTGGMLDLGTWGSYGIEKLHLTLDAAWQDLTITAFFNVNGEVVAKKVVGKDGYADVPWEATKENTFSGCLAFEGSINGQRRISTNLNYKVTNHSETTDSDPVPTDDRWNQFVTETKGYRDGAFEAAEKANARAEDAETASEDAQAAARAAKASENAAAASASNAAADAGKAGPYAKAAQAAQEAAENAAAAAAASKSAADTLAAEAARAAKAAKNSKVAANNAAYFAGENATAAQKAAATATAAANDAGQSASDAAASKAAAETAAKAAQDAQTATAAAKAEAVKAQETQKLVILNGTESWNSWGINAHNPAITGFYTYDINDYDAKNAKGICSHLETPNQDVWGGRNAGIGFATVGSSRYFMFSMLTSSLPDISAGHEVDSLKAYLAAQNDAGTPVQIAYKLATPTPFTATGAQPIPALAGANTILTDADVVEVTGRADPIKRITDLEDAVASQT